MHEEIAWSREVPRSFWDPSRKLILSIRTYQRHKNGQGPISWLIAKSCVMRHRFWSVIAGADIPLNCIIGGGFALPHPNGVVIHPESPVGVNCLFFQQTTVTGHCIIGNNVYIGAGAKLIRVKIGNNVKIGANAVVLSDIPDNCTAAGVPAKVIGHRQDLPVDSLSSD
jgi:serine O-acetyltransferase